MNLLEKYYLQGKGKLMAGIFVLVVLLIISTIAFTGCFSSGKKSDDKIRLPYLIMEIILM